MCKAALKFIDIDVNAKSLFSNDFFDKDDKQRMERMPTILSGGN